MSNLKSDIKVRHEYKYLLSYGEYLQLKKLLDKTMNIDKNSMSNGGYHIRSLYFDDVYDTGLSEKYSGIAYRRKFRIRIYNFSDKSIKLEEKIKHNRHIQKKACKISKVEYESIFEGNAQVLLNSGNKVKESYYYQIRNNMLKPKVIVDYNREAYTFPFNQIRITFDRGLSAQKPCKDIFTDKLVSHSVGKEYSIILEVKFNNYLPNHIKNILAMYCRNSTAASKYVLCREFLSI